MILLKNELSAIGNNFNQAVQKRFVGILWITSTQMKSWLLVYDSMHKTFVNKTSGGELKKDSIKSMNYGRKNNQPA